MTPPGFNKRSEQEIRIVRSAFLTRPLDRSARLLSRTQPVRVAHAFDGNDGNGGGEVSEPEPIAISGSDNDVIDVIDIAGGLVTANAEDSGGDNFIVQLVPDQGDYNALLINTIGAYQGVAAELTAEGTYQLSVEASGDWEIELQQPRVSSGR